ncbi:hypothetical protein [Spartinivicinus ruber]|uniref:hypothetical protein n=1 Tax=Spartinivicinus ruber TaxID=2683272 RepID=UPI0013D8B578|nr:hypothetical protein [Spartinivicinus ruber]
MLKKLPTLNEARLVMLANLLSPKSHHSYHEIMSATIGISDGKDMLIYQHPNSYEDIKRTAIGRDAFDQVEIASKKNNINPDIERFH